MKRPKTCCDPARDEYPQLPFYFVKYTESVSTMFKPIRRRTPTLFKCCSLIFDRITCHIVGHPEPEKKILLAFLSTFWHPCSKCILMCFKKNRG